MTALPAFDTDQRLDVDASDETPLDWPGPGPIDLAVHDLPHASSTLEWWYLNCHLVTREGREVSLFAAFFRERAGVDPETEGTIYAHSVAWAVSEPERARYHPKVAVDARAPALGLAKLDAARHVSSGRIDRALREVLERGRVPGPTRLLDSPAVVSQSLLHLEYGCDRLIKLHADEYELSLYDEAAEIGCSLRFVPRKNAIRYGTEGIVHGVQDERMFYYFIPRCDVRGQLTIDGASVGVDEGSGWMDHEFGYTPRASGRRGSRAGESAGQSAWRWVSLQLDNGYELSIFLVTRAGSGEVLDKWCLLVDPEGDRLVYTAFELRETDTWRSTRSFVTYPIAFALSVPEAQMVLELRAAFPDQEVLTIISDPAFWEGRVNAEGQLRGRAFRGKGWVECKGFRFADVDGFLGAVGAEVRGRLNALFPSVLSREAVARCSVRGHDIPGAEARYSEGVNAEALSRSLTRPIMELATRGGKAWRSYAALACIDVVGGDSRKFLHWLVIPELLHVGSLIVDDVEDGSQMRRGGPACHVMFGEPLAINAGTAAYFLAEPPLENDELSLTSKLKIYRLYFEALRAGHAGQALDIKGHDAQARLCAWGGTTRQLEEQVLSVHRLKTGVPAGMLARIGAVLGGGSPSQVEALGRFFEALGLAFQILDDVLNLRGFQNELKERGEDVRQGKVTLPIVKAFERLPTASRVWLHQALVAKSDDPLHVRRIIALLENVGALDACVADARSVVDSAWEELDPLLEDSQFKLMFRAFSDYVLERHY